MKTKIIYTTIDDREFDNQFEAKKHECNLLGHEWLFYSDNMSSQEEKDEKSKVAFCKKCNKQEILK